MLPPFTYGAIWFLLKFLWLMDPRFSVALSWLGLLQYIYLRPYYRYLSTHGYRRSLLVFRIAAFVVFLNHLHGIVAVVSA